MELILVWHTVRANHRLSCSSSTVDHCN